MKKPLPPAYFLASLIGIVLLHIFLPVSRYLNFPWNLLGLVPLAAGIYLNIVADRGFKTRGTTVTPFEESSSLVQEFPFSVTRNPMYLGITLMLLGAALLLGTIGALIPVPLFPLLMDVLFIRTEELMLAKTFGAEWQEYRARVRRWI